jgi:hypothetical protein
MTSAVEGNVALRASEPPSPTEAPGPATPYREVRYEHSRNLPGIREHLGASLLVSTYQAGKLIVVGAREGALALSFHNGGNGLGGGLYNDGSTAFGVSTLTVTGTTITHNDADGGAAGAGGSAGQGIGGGLYLADGGIVCLDVFTQAHAKKNHASTSNDDIFGSFTTC